MSPTLSPREYRPAHRSSILRTDRRIHGNAESHGSGQGNQHGREAAPKIAGMAHHVPENSRMTHPLGIDYCAVQVSNYTSAFMADNTLRHR